MVNRRRFLVTCGGVVAAPAFAHFGLPLAGGDSSHLTVSVAPATTVTPTLRIDGWEFGADSDADAWVQINSSWRATWR